MLEVALSFEGFLFGFVQATLPALSMSFRSRCRGFTYSHKRADLAADGLLLLLTVFGNIFRLILDTFLRSHTAMPRRRLLLTHAVAIELLADFCLSHRTSMGMATAAGAAGNLGNEDRARF